MTVDRDDHPSTLLADRTRRPALALPEAPATATSGLRGAAARVLFERVARRLPIVVEYGPSDIGARGDLPTMTITEPDAFFRRIGSDGLIGLGESYMAGEWTADDLVGVLVPFAERIGTVVPRSLQRL